MSWLVRYVVVFHFLIDAGNVVFHWHEFSLGMGFLNLLANLLMAMVFLLKLEALQWEWP